MAGLESSRSTCLTACLSFRLRAAARPWPMVQTAREALCNTPRVALQSESTRLACRSCSSKPPRTSRTSLNENRCLMTIAFLDSVLPRGRLACCDGTGNRVRQFARICHPRRSSDSFRDHPHDRPVLLCLNENEGMGKVRGLIQRPAWGLRRCPGAVAEARPIQSLGSAPLAPSPPQLSAKQAQADTDDREGGTGWLPA